jgi:hypothetical protein
VEGWFLIAQKKFWEVQVAFIFLHQFLVSLNFISSSSFFFQEEEGLPYMERRLKMKLLMTSNIQVNFTVTVYS